ncbi:hypothetical protein ASPCADRAFT_179627 [Aspergillus carbonarius ITEM 5010]|uniref:DUF7924 domain-containing protein n=1 Tax=Aspergillus carbonarius (strain ITEM 5010) TaxID=602072 RepID=A0A1R3R6Q0_ASPC5|nr:hypothetical protein ASPCADRAFT_179627 [Aspergillus carbonarius ITEM 5010]
MFDENNIAAFERSLWGSSATRLLVDLHPLLFPSAETQFIRGRRCLEHISDAYNDPWNKIQPNYEPLPQPSHTRGLLQSMFDSAQRWKLEIWPQRKSLYKARENLLFPYLIAEVIGQPERLENADQKVKYDVPIAVFGLVSLAQKARRMESLHRRILAFSLSHNHEIVSLHGYYLVIDGETFTYWRRLIKQFKIWTVETKWLCYRFVHNLDEYFLPRHIRRIMDMLEHIPEPPSIDFTEEYWLNNPPIDLIQCGLANTQLMEANRTWLAQTAGKDRNQRIME